MRTRFLAVVTAIFALATFTGCESFQRGYDAARGNAVPALPITQSPTVMSGNLAPPAIVIPSASPSSSEMGFVSGAITPGDGHSYVFAPERKHRNKTAIATVIRSDDRKVLRVRADTMMSQVAKRLNRGDWESRSAFADWLSSAEVEMVKCTPALLSQHTLGRVSGEGTTFDFLWKRDKCDPGEHFLVHNGVVFMSTTCMNLMVEKQLPRVYTPPPAPPARVAEIGMCPSGRSVTYHVWKRSALPADLQEKADVSGRSEKGYVSADHFSRGLGAQLRERVGDRGLSQTPFTAVVSVDSKPQTVTFVGKTTVAIAGGNPPKTVDLVPANQITLVYPAQDTDGNRRLRIFDWEWRGCELYAHIVISE